MAKHGNWNATPHLYDPIGVQRERRQRRHDAVFAVARQMFDVVIDSDLGSEQQDCAVALFNTLWARRPEK